MLDWFSHDRDVIGVCFYFKKSTFILYRQNGVIPNVISDWILVEILRSRWKTLCAKNFLFTSWVTDYED